MELQRRCASWASAKTFAIRYLYFAIADSLHQLTRNNANQSVWPGDNLALSIHAI